jgi:hypothetical protein
MILLAFIPLVRLLRRSARLRNLRIKRASFPCRPVEITKKNSWLLYALDGFRAGAFDLIDLAVPIVVFTTNARGSLHLVSDAHF